MSNIPEYHYIKGIDKTVKERLKELDLTPKLSLSSFKKKKKRFYSLPCATKDKKKVFFKILLVEEDWVGRLLKRETIVTKLLTNYPNLNIPGFVSADIENMPYWFIHEYLPGPLVGHFYEIYKQGQKKEIIRKIADNLLAFQTINKKKKKITSRIPFLGERGFKTHLHIIKEREGLVKDKKGIDFKSIYQFAKKQEKYLKEAEFVLTHGDFTLANFFTNKNKVYVTDWEHVRLDNRAADISHLWIQTWRFPAWRKELLSYFISKLPKNSQNKFKEIFRLIIITEALGELAYSIYICPKKYINDSKKFAKKTIESSLKGFDFLLNI